MLKTRLCQGTLAIAKSHDETGQIALVRICVWVEEQDIAVLQRVQCCVGRDYTTYFTLQLQRQTQQYLRWLGDLVRGDLGYSFGSRLPVFPGLLQALPYTVELAIGATFDPLESGLIRHDSDSAW